MRALLRKYKSRKYLKRIFVSINVLIIFFMLLSSLTMYLYAERTILKSQREANTKVLSQINYNITNMNEIVKNVAVSIFFDNNFISLLDGPVEDAFEDGWRINRLQKIIAPTTFIHSVVIYNSKRQVYFTAGADSLIHQSDAFLKRMDDYLSGREQLYKMQFVPVKMAPGPKNEVGSPDYFSLFMYDSLARYSKSKSMLIVNVQPQWLFENIELMNGAASKANSRIYILDQNKNIFSSRKQETANTDDLKNAVYRHIAATNETVSQFTYTYRNEKLVVNYMTNRLNNWIILNVQPYDAILGDINQMKIASIVVTIVCFALAAFVSIYVSQKLYHPIEGLLIQVKRLSGNEDDGLKENDELRYMSQVYNRFMEKMNDEEMKKGVNESIIKSYYLRKLITDSPSFTPEELSECAEKRYFTVSPENWFMLAVLKIDDYKRFAANTTASENMVYRFAVSNIAEEILSEELACDIVDMRGDHLVVLMQIGESAKDRYPNLTDLFRRIQDTVRSYYHFTFTTALSDIITNYKEITFYYGKALEYSMYRMNIGKNTVITPKMVNRIIGNDLHQIPGELEKKLIEAIRSSHQPGIHEQLDKIRTAISGMSYEAALQSVIHLGIIVNHTIREINQNKLTPVLIDHRRLNRSFVEKETLDEVFAEFADLFRYLSTEQRRLSDNKNDVLVETLKEMIQANYSDPNISLQGISEMLKMSAAYVGRLFKKSEGLSVSEYIYEVRLTEAVKLLESKAIPINEIAEKVGFANQTYFFKLFKKKFGATPKEYRLKKSLK